MTTLIKAENLSADLYGCLTFPDRATAAVATIPDNTDVIAVLDRGSVLFYQRDPAGTALTTAGSVTWSPALDKRAAHYDQDYRSFMPVGTFGGTWQASRIIADSDLTTPFSGTRVSQAITRTVTGAGASNPIGDYTQFLVANNPDIMDTTAGELGALRMLVVANGVGDKDIFIGSVNKQIGDGTINEGAVLAYEMGSRLVDGSLSNIVDHHQILGAFSPNPASVWGGRGHHGYYSEHYKGVGYSHFTGIDDGYGTGLTSMTYGIALFRKRDPATAYFTVEADTGAVKSLWNAAGAAGGSWKRTRNKAVGAANDILWNDYWDGANAAGSLMSYARVYGAISDATAGSEDGMVQFLTLVNGSETAQLQIKNGLAVGNAASGALGTGSVNIASSYSINGATVVDGSRGVRLASYTTAQLNDITNAVNTSQKAEGKMVWNTTLKIPVFAVGATAGSTWNTAAGAVSSTPV